MGDQFDAFCYSMVSRPHWGGRISPEALASEFVWFFRLPAFPRLKDVESLVLQSNLAQVVPMPMPRELHGFNFPAGIFYWIFYNSEGSEWNRTFTLLHELEEVLERKLSCLSDYIPARNSEKERRSDRFAQSVLLQPEVAAICSRLVSNATDFLARKFRVPSQTIDMCLKEVLDSGRAITKSYTRNGRSTRWNICCESRLNWDSDHWSAPHDVLQSALTTSKAAVPIGGLCGFRLWRLNPLTVAANLNLWHPLALHGPYNLAVSSIPLRRMEI